MAETDTERDDKKKASPNWFTEGYLGDLTAPYPALPPVTPPPPTPPVTFPERPPPQDAPTPAPPQFWGPGTNRKGTPPLFPAGAEAAPAPLKGPPDTWDPPVSPAGPNAGKRAVNQTTGEWWYSTGQAWKPLGSQAGKQTASTGEPGEAGAEAPTVPALPEPAAFTFPGEARTKDDMTATEPALPAPATATPELEPPAGGWDPTATAPDAALAQKAVAAITHPQRGGMPSLDPIAQSEIARMQMERAWHEKLQQAKDAALTEARTQQQRAIEEVKAAGADVRNYLERTKQPVPPELQKTPPRPDVTIRPWLDPEGKSAISVIAQTLGMLAVGAAGVHYKAPLTAMRYFREAAENWRRDEVDAANSKLKQFEMEVTGIKNDNEVALKQYELADKQYAHNLEAKKAFMLSKLQNLELNDKAIQLTSLPYDEAMKQSQVAFTQSGKILEELTKLQEVGVKLAKLNQDALPKSVVGAEAIMAHADRSLRELPPGTPADDPQRLAIQRERDLAEDFLKRHQQTQSIQSQERQNTVRASAELKDANEQLRLANFFENRLDRLSDLYQILDEEKVLPTSRALIPETWATLKRKALPMSPRAAAAVRALESLFPETMVGAARTFMNEKGNVAQKAWGKLADEIMPITEATGVMRNLADMMADTKRHATMIIKTREELLRAVPYRDYDPTATE